jgi:hypothetical protein
VAFALLAAIWPSLSSGLGVAGFSGGSSTRIPFEAHPIVLEIPAVPLPNGTTLGGQTIEMMPWQAVLGLTAVFLGAIVVVGGGIALAYVLLSRLVTRTAESESFKQNAAALESKENQKLKEKRAGRAALPMRQDISMPRWSLISTTLIVLTFVIFGSMVVVTYFFPERVVEMGNDLFQPGFILVGIPVLITLALFVFAPRWGTAVLALIVMLFVALATFGVVNLVSTSTGTVLSISAVFSIVGLVQILTLAILAYRWRTESAAEFNAKVAHADVRGREKGIPYDAIIVLFTGLLIVGLGVGLMVLINSPAWTDIQPLFGQ